MRRRTVLGLGLAMLAAVAGCGGGFQPDAGVIVTGKVVQGGQPIALDGAIPGYGKVEVQVIEPTAGSSIAAAHCEADGSFEIVHGGGGIPPGKYKLAIRAQKDPDTDLLQGKLSEQNTTIEVNVPADKLGGQHDLGTIEVGTYIQ
jgi:hypothetical protein